MRTVLEKDDQRVAPTMFVEKKKIDDKNEKYGRYGHSQITSIRGVLLRIPPMEKPREEEACEAWRAKFSPLVCHANAPRGYSFPRGRGQTWAYRGKKI